MVTETIVVETEFHDMIAGGLRQLNREVQEFSNTMRKTTTTAMQPAGTGMRVISRTIKKATGNFRKFRMELLSVMFGSQMVAGAMWGLLKPAMEAAGIFELISTTLLMLFLPTAMAMVDPLIDIVTWFMNLPEPVKQFIGAIVLLVGTFATYLATGAALKLFMDGLMSDFTKMGGTGGALDMLKDKFAAFAKVAAIGVGVYFASESLDDLKEGKFLDAAVNALLSGLSFAYALGKVKAKTAILVGVGVYFASESINSIKEGKYLDALANSLISSGSFLALKAPYAGGVIIALGFTLKFIKPLANAFKDAIDWFNDKIAGPIQRALGYDVSPITLEAPKTWKKPKGSTNFVPNQSGGYIPHNGLYKLHAGESVNQSGSNSFSPTINVNASSNVDIEMLKTQLSSQWNDELSRLSRG